MEIELSRRKYTCANNLANPTFEKLDRILVTTEWEEKYPLTTVRALTRGVSDHTPLLLNTGESSFTATQPIFKCEFGWLLRDGFMEMVKDIWDHIVEGHTTIERWQGKICRLRQYLRGWAKNMSEQYKKEKKEILNTLDTYKNAENSPLRLEEISIKQCLNNRLARLLREEEMKWYQRAKTKDLLEGDSNTKYFQLVASGKYRKTRIFQLQHEDGIIEGEQALKDCITTYYKDMSGPPKNSSVSLEETRVDDNVQVSQEENDLLVRPFTVEEVRDAVFQMEHNKAPGPNGFPTEFYQSCWEIIKYDLMKLFWEFHNGNLSLFSLNFGTIILLPKSREATHIQ
jgi:hypothetical protein